MHFIQKKILSLLSELGVEHCVMVISDPDSPDVLTLKKGDVVWRVGAWELMRHDLTIPWTEPEKKLGTKEEGENE